jgi:hypothetical protein
MNLKRPPNPEKIYCWYNGAGFNYSGRANRTTVQIIASPKGADSPVRPYSSRMRPNSGSKGAK